MADVPEDYYSEPDVAEHREPEASESPHLVENGQPDPVPEAAAQDLHVENVQKPQPRMEEEDFREGPLESAENVHPHLQPVELSEEEELSKEEEIPGESEVDLSRETEHQEVELERFVGVEEELLEDLAVSVGENHESHPELSKETESEVPGAAVSEMRLELQENLLKESPQQDGKMELQSPDLTKPESPSEEPRNSTEEAGIQPPEMTKLESPAMTQRMSPEEKRTVPFEQVKPEFPEETQGKSIEETVTEPSEQTKSEFPDRKSHKSTKKTQRKSIEEKIPEAQEDIESEFLEERSRKSTEETDVVPSEKTKPVQEEIQRKSTAEEVLEPPEESKPAHRKDKQRKSSGEIMRTSRKRSEVPPQTEPGVQEKTQTEPAKEKDPALTDKDKEPHGKDTHVELSKEDEPNPIKNKHSAEFVVQHDYQTRKLSKKGKRDTLLGSLTISDVDSSVSYDFYKKVDSMFEAVDSSDYDYSSVYQNILPESISEMDSVASSLHSEEQVPQDEKKPSKSSVSPSPFEFLTWSPEKVAEWISELGFPQYKECITTNFISGRKLIHVNCSNLPQMGITDFEDMKVISRHTRALLGIEEPLFSRSISLPYRDNIGLFLEQKGHSGVKSDSLTFAEFIEKAGLQDYAPQITEAN